MNKLLLFSLVTALTSLASAEVVKTCKVTIKLPPQAGPEAAKEIPTTFRISKNKDGKLTATTIQKIDGHDVEIAKDEEVTLREDSVRENMSETQQDLNQTERLILGTQGL